MGRAGVAVVAHGCGSSADFVRRTFGRACAAAQLDLVTWDDRSGDVEVVAAELGRLAEATGAGVVGGVSLGAHAAAAWAAGRDLDGVLLVLPAWTGAPGVTAAMSAAAADEVERAGRDAVLARLATDGGWVGRELARAWRRYDEADLVAALRAGARSAAPVRATLSRVRAPAGVVALAGDEVHPEDVARAWQLALPAARLAVVPAGEPAHDVAVLGDSAVRAWLHARRGAPLSAPR
jgi:pimeloyl-ACP methyl ester carboxylesterase